MTTRQPHASEVEDILPEHESPGGETILHVFRFEGGQARKHAPKEFIPQSRDPLACLQQAGAPSLSGIALRGRLLSKWYDRIRDPHQDLFMSPFVAEGRAPLKPFVLRKDEGRSVALKPDRSSGDRGEKTSLLLLAFSPIIDWGEHYSNGA